MIFQSVKTRFFLLSAVVILAISCKQVDVFEKNTSIPHYKWQQNFAATGSFIITDTTTPYNIYIVLRHTDAYRYNNIWLKVGLQAPGDTMYLQNINLPLATDATGWEGTGMNDIWEVRKLVGHRGFKKGEYKFVINQLMRNNPLPEVMSAGMRIQKAN